jgi:TatD DNase family protein
MMLVDIGANLTHQSFELDYAEVLEKAQLDGVKHIIITGTDLITSEASASLASKHPNFLSSTVGIHPHNASKASPKQLAHLAQLIEHNKVVAIGETGLDYNRNYAPKKDQLKIFQHHLELAKNFNKPLFLHQRDSHKDFLPLLQRYRPYIVGGVVHCFTDNEESLLEYLDLDMHIGITGWICDERRGQDLQKIVHHIPLDRLLLETDAPYLLPRTIKPKPKTRRNEPRYLKDVAAHVAKHMSLEIEEVAACSTRNAIKLFDLPI